MKSESGPAMTLDIAALDTALECPFSIGASGWCVGGVAAGRSIWW
jgi:hypothetical protein